MKKAFTVIRVLLALFLIIGACGNRAEFPVAAPISIVLGVLLLLWPLFALLLARKKAASAPQPEVHVITKAEAATFSNEKGMYDYEYSNCGIYRPEGLDLPLPPVGALLTFEEDPENVYDADAVKAVWNGQTVGWLYRKGKREMIRDWIQRGDEYMAEVTANTPELKFWIGMNK